MKPLKLLIIALMVGHVIGFASAWFGDWLEWALSRFDDDDGGDDGDLQFEPRRPVWRVEGIACDVEQESWLKHKSPAAKPHGAKRQGPGAARHKTASGQRHL